MNAAKLALEIMYQPFYPWAETPYAVYLVGGTTRVSDPPLARFPTEDEAHEYCKGRLACKLVARYELPT